MLYLERNKKETVLKGTFKVEHKNKILKVQQYEKKSNKENAHINTVKRRSVCRYLYAR